MADSTPRKWLQFRLQSVLWLTLVIAVGLGTYWRGYQAGLADKANQRSDVGSTFVKLYNVGDIVPMRRGESDVFADVNALVEDVSTHVLPNTWTESGGNASIAGFGANPALVISHDEDGHERVAAYLDRLRAKAQQLLKSK